MLKRIVFEIASRIAYWFEVECRTDNRGTDWLYSLTRDIEDWSMHENKKEY